MPLIYWGILGGIGLFGMSAKATGSGIEDAGTGIATASNGLVKVMIVAGVIYAVHLYAKGGFKA